MTFSRLNATGWTDDVSTFTAAQANGIDINQSRAVDGNAGGAYLPSAAIQIGGSGLQLTTVAGAASNIQLASRSIVRHQSMLGSTISGNWSQDTSHLWRNTAVGGLLWLELDRLAHGQVLQEVHLRWDGTAHGGGWPVVAPQIDLFRVDQDGVATSVTGAPAADPTVPGDQAGYELPHDISFTAIAHTVDLTLYRYYLEVQGETGGNFAANARALSLRVSIDCTGYTEYT